MRARVGVLLLTAVLALAGCDGPSSPPAGSPSAGFPSSAGVPTPTTASPSPTLPTMPTDLDAYIRAGGTVTLHTYIDMTSGLYSFSTPSGNISCGLINNSPEFVCGISESSWPSTASRTCEGNSLWVPNWVTLDATGVTRGACSPESHFTMHGIVLPYGSTISVEILGYGSNPGSTTACRSESAFLACALLGTGNGFAIAKAVYHTYGHVNA